jgi:hypothetical protein
MTDKELTEALLTDLILDNERIFFDKLSDPNEAIKESKFLFNQSMFNFNLNRGNSFYKKIT